MKHFILYLAVIFLFSINLLFSQLSPPFNIITDGITIVAEGNSHPAVIWQWEDENLENANCSGYYNYTDCNGVCFNNDIPQYTGYDCIIDDGSCFDLTGDGIIDDWLGDNYCDNSSYGLSLFCDDFNYDGNDCSDGYIDDEYYNNAVSFRLITTDIEGNPDGSEYTVEGNQVAIWGSEGSTICGYVIAQNIQGEISSPTGIACASIGIPESGYCPNNNCNEFDDVGCIVDGDSNEDYNINVLDIVLIVGMILGENEFTEIEFCKSDLNKDLALDVLDIIILVNLIMGEEELEYVFPSEKSGQIVWNGNDYLEYEDWRQEWGLWAWNEDLEIVTNGFWGYNNIDLVPDPHNPDHTVIRVFHEEDSVTIESGAGLLFFPAFSLLDEKRACLSYDVLFNDEFDFGTVGGKIPGLYGIDFESGITLDANTCTGPLSYDSNKCFSARFSYRGLPGQGFPETDMFYEVIPWMDERECRENWLCNLPYGSGMVMRTGIPESFQAVNGQWKNIRQEIKLNDKGLANGWIKVWYENEQVINEYNITITPSGDVPISGILFHAIFGQGFDLDQGSPGNQYSYYANFKIADNCNAFDE